MRLIQPTLPQWYRGFDPIEVPWEDPTGSTGLPDIMGIVGRNAERAQGMQNPDGTWDFPWQQPDEEEDDDNQGLPPPVIPSPEEERPPPDDNGGGGFNGPGMDGTDEEPEIPTIDSGTIWAGGGAFPDVRPIPSDEGEERPVDWGAIGGAVGGAIGDPPREEIPQLVAGGGQAPKQIVINPMNWLQRLNGLQAALDFKENPQAGIVGLATLANPLAGTVFGAGIALSNLLSNNLNAPDWDEINKARGRAYLDAVFGDWWTNGLGRNPEWLGNPEELGALPSRAGAGPDDYAYLPKMLFGLKNWLITLITTTVNPKAIIRLPS